MASVKSLMTGLSQRGPHRVLRGDLGITGQPGIVFTPEKGLSLPAVVFGHGWMTSVKNYRALLEHLASWGFVVAAPDNERGPVPSHLGLATDLLTTIDICTGVRLGTGDISVHPAKVALAGHGMGAGAAIIAAAQRDVAAVAAIFPAPTAPAAETVASGLDVPALILASGGDTVHLNAKKLARAWGLPAGAGSPTVREAERSEAGHKSSVAGRGDLVLRSVKDASASGLIEGRRLAAAVGLGKHHRGTAKSVRALLTGYLLATAANDKTYRDFADATAKIPGTVAIDPHAPEEPVKLSRFAQISQLLGR